MVRRPQAVVLSAQPLEGDVFKGGAERVAAGVGRHLLSLGWDCTWLSSASWSDSVPAGFTLAEGLRGQGAVARPVRAAGAAAGAPGTALTPVQVLDSIVAAGLVVAVDRAVGAIPGAGRRVLLLSNLAYANERRAAAAGECERAWVPSEYLRQRLLAEHRWPPGAVQVVPPVAVDPVSCTLATHAPVARVAPRLAATKRPRARRLLFPHRADPGKGLASAIGLLGRLVPDDDRWTLIVSRANDREGPSARRFIEQMAGLAEETGVGAHVEWVPWLPGPEMPCLYGLAGCTLGASTLDEGFGLVAVESVAAGVPVVTRGVGNVRHLAATLPGVHEVDDLDSVRAADLVVAVGGSRLTGTAVRAARSAYSAARQRAATVAALGASPAACARHAGAESGGRGR